MIKSIAIGSFDGIHLAHQELIKRVDGVVVIERGYATLTPGWKRSIYTNKATFFYLFEKIKHLTPQEFIELLNSHFPNLQKIVVGYDFKFGLNASGNIELLKELFSGTVEVVDEVKVDRISVHSKVIREFIKSSNIKMANKLLGRNYRVDGKHIRGLGLGSKELVPTINLKVINYTLPNGVFAINAIINGKKYRAVCFIGHRESIDNSFSVEFHILDEFKDDIKGKIWVEFIEFIRYNNKFNNLNELKKQIEKDIEVARLVISN